MPAFLCLSEFIGTALYITTSFSALVVYDRARVDPVTYQSYAASVFASSIVLSILVSGARFLNPAIALAAAIADPQSHARFLIPVSLAQVAGGMLAVGIVTALIPAPLPGSARILFVHNTRLGQPQISIIAAFILEALATCVLSIASLSKSELSLVAIAEAVFCVHLFLLHLTACAVNPVRALAGAVGSGVFHELWVFTVAPMVGGALAGALLWGRREAERRWGGLS